MVSTTINPGLEIWHLSWKDDSFRMSEWFDYIVSGNVLENQITFTNGIITTTGVYGIGASVVLTNGDEMTLPAVNGSAASIYVQKNFGTEATVLSIPPAAVVNVNFRAKNIGTTNTITITILQTGGHSNVLSPVTIGSSEYERYTVPITGISFDIIGIQLQVNTSSVILDYICFATDDFINQGGMALDVTIPKKTISQTIPNSHDIMQQLGINSRSKAVTIPKIGISTYRWLQDIMTNSTPLELVTPTEQATGYLSEIQRNSDAGWVDSLLVSNDSLSAQVSGAQQLYDISFTLVKADNEQNIDATIPSPSVSLVVHTQVTLQAITPSFTPIGNPVTLEVANFTESQSAKLVTYPRVQAFLDTSLVIGTFNSTYNLTTIVPQDFVHGEDIETLLATLEYPYQVLTDAEGYQDYVMVTQTQTSHSGGQPYYYSVDIGLTSLGLPLVPPSSGPPSPVSINEIVPGVNYFEPPPNRNIIWAQGLWWVFYVQAPLGVFSLFYQTSSDGSHWNGQVRVSTLGDTSTGEAFGIWQSGNTVYVVWPTGGAPTVTYRYGTMQPNGTISWSIAESHVTFGTNFTNTPSICTDSLGNIWIAAAEYTSGVTNLVVQNNISGPFTVSLNLTTPVAIPSLYNTILPLGSDMVFIYGGYIGSNFVHVQWFNGSVWSSPQTTGVGSSSFSTATVGSTLYLTSGTGFQTWTTGGGFSSSTVVGTGFSTLTVNGSVIFVMSADSGHIYYNYSLNGGATWAGITTYATTAVTVFENIYSIGYDAYAINWLDNVSNLLFAVIKI